MRELISCLASIIKWDGPVDELLIVPLSGRLRTASGVDVVEAFQHSKLAIPFSDSGRTSGELRSTELGLRCLLMVARRDDGGATSDNGQMVGEPLAVVDGWRMIRCTTELDLSDADLTGADLRSAPLRGSCLRGAMLMRANLSYADLTGEADLSHADLRGASLVRADLSDADLRCADLRRADLTEARLSGAKTVGSVWRGCEAWSAQLANTDLTAAFTEGFDFMRGDHRGSYSTSGQKAARPAVA